VTRYPYASKDAHHAITYGTAETLACKYAKMSKLIQDSNNEEVLTVAWTQFPAGTTIGYEDKIVLPDGSYSRIARIHRVHNHLGTEVCVETYYGGESL